MNDRPLTLILVSVAILVALYVRRTRAPVLSPGKIAASEFLTPTEMKRIGKLHGIEVNFGQSMTREQFDRILGPVSVP